MLLPSHTGGSNWPGAALDVETGVMYVSSINQQDVLALSVADPKRSDMGYVGGRGGGSAGRGGRGGAPSVSAAIPSGEGELGNRPAPKVNIGPQGLPLIKPPWGSITAIDLNSGDHVWRIPNGHPPDYVVNHPAMKGIDLSNAGRPSRALLMVTKSLLISTDGSNLFNTPAGGGGNLLRAIDKKTGKVLHEVALPAMATGVPMTYMVDDRQFIVVAVGAQGVPASLVALALP